MVSWDKTWIDIADEISKRSKDSSTKVGAVIVNDKKQMLSVGYNGAPRPFNDDDVPNDNTAVNLLYKKNTYMIHAEVNAILNYHGDIDDLSGSTMYVTISPCHECAKIIAQVGIKSVVYKEKYHNAEIANVGLLILRTCGVEVRKL